MFSKKDDKLVDLEYMIPKEHKQESMRLETDAVVRPTPSGPESCFSCSRNSDEVVLVPAFHQGSDGWICPKCLKQKIDAEGYFGSNDGYSQADPYSSLSGGSSDSDESYGSDSSTDVEDTPSTDYSGGGPMSMFD